MSSCCVFHSLSIPQENISFRQNHILTFLWCIFNKLPLTNSCSTLPFFFVFPDIFTPLSNQWYIEMYEPIILLIKLSCPCYIYFPPNLLFHFSLLSHFSRSLTLSISLFVPWLTPVNIFPLQGWKKFRLIQNIMPSWDSHGRWWLMTWWRIQTSRHHWVWNWDPSAVLHSDNVQHFLVRIMFLEKRKRELPAMSRWKFFFQNCHNNMRNICESVASMCLCHLI